MSTEAQIAANRLNAQKSTGPRTAEGKAVASQNAVKHGLFASENVINGENQADFDLFRGELLAELARSGVIESTLAARVVSLSWRLKRAERMHNEALDVMLAKVETAPWEERLRTSCDEAYDPEDEELDFVLGRATIEDLSNSRVLERLMMYERRIEHSLFKTRNELQRRRLMRELEETEAVEAEPAPEPCLAPAHNAEYKKQSQCAAALTDVKVSGGKHYENSTSQEHREDKPNQSQFEPIPADLRKRLPQSCGL